MNERPLSEEEVVIAGSSLLSVALAIDLAKANKAVTLLPIKVMRDNLSSGLLSAESLRRLDALGCSSTVDSLNPPSIHSTRIFLRSGERFVSSLFGRSIGLSEVALRRVLLDRAKALGVRTHEGAKVVGLQTKEDGVRVDLEIQVDGEITKSHVRTSIVVADTALVHEVGPAIALGLARHHRPVPGPIGDRMLEALDAHVELYAFDGGFCTMSCIEDEEILVRVFIQDELIDDLRDTEWSTVRNALTAMNVQLADRFEAMLPSGETATAGIPLLTKTPQDQAGVLLVHPDVPSGAPTSGHDEALALSSAVTLAALMESLSHRPSASQMRKVANQWRTRQKLLFAPRHWAANQLRARLLSTSSEADSDPVLDKELSELMRQLTRGST